LPDIGRIAFLKAATLPGKAGWRGPYFIFGLLLMRGLYIAAQ
jgi:hypothetical protein